MRREFRTINFKAPLKTDWKKNSTSEWFDGEFAEKFLNQQNFLLARIYTKKQETQFKV